ncbi:MAG: hypothetical protein JWN62_2910 [Acidimicrobiales bacterium]|nr:hypothetical protein [Acidimicrobiales bacterium]
MANVQVVDLRCGKQARRSSRSTFDCPTGRVHDRLEHRAAGAILRMQTASTRSGWRHEHTAIPAGSCACEERASTSSMTSATAARVLAPARPSTSSPRCSRAAEFPTIVTAIGANYSSVDHLPISRRAQELVQLLGIGPIPETTRSGGWQRGTDYWRRGERPP